MVTMCGLVSILEAFSTTVPQGVERTFTGTPMSAMLAWKSRANCSSKGTCEIQCTSIG